MEVLLFDAFVIISIPQITHRGAVGIHHDHSGWDEME